jgi:tetratricopeptide (TPR) repeat protein
MAKKHPKRAKGRRKPSRKPISPSRQKATGFKWQRPQLMLGGILLLTLLSFLPLFNNEFTNWDDNVYVTENQVIRSLSGENIAEMFDVEKPVSSNYHPLTLLSYALNYQVSGLEPWSYTLFQILFHLLNTFLVYLLVKKLTEGKETIALFVALFFGIHPMHVESVAWLSEHKDVLYTFFLLLSLLAYLRYVKEESWLRYGLALLFFLFSLLSKSAAVAMAPALFLVDYWLKRPLNARLFLEKIPFLALAVLFGIIALNTQSEAINESYTFAQRVIYASYGFTMYFVKLFVPFGLSSFYPYPAAGEPDPSFLFVLFPVVVLGLTAFSMRKTRLFAFGVGFFLVMVSLTLQVLAVGGQIMADRYTYVPYLGLFFLLGYGLWWMGEQKKYQAYVKPLTYGVVAVGLLFAFVSFQRTRDWKDSYTLWSDVIEKHPKCGRAWLMRGVLYYDQQKDDLAFEHFDKAVTYRPTMAFCYHNRGLVLERKKRYEEALRDYNEAIRRKGDYYEAFHHRGNVMYYTGKFDKALADYSKALSINPNFARSYTNRGLAYYNRKQYQQAAADLQRAGQLDPTNSLIFNNLGSVYSATGQPQKALEAYGQAIRINPNDKGAYRNRALIYRQLGQIEKAKQDEARGR